MNRLANISPASDVKEGVPCPLKNLLPSEKTENEEAVRKRRKGLAKRFWTKVNKNGPIPLLYPELGPCWEFNGCRNEHNYGDFCTTHERKKHDKAHRVSWLLHYGEAPELFVLHRCDNPPCVNPAHLFLGTYKDNGQDMLQKGRNRNKVFKGEDNGFSKLTWENVKKLRSLYGSGVVTNKTELGRMFRVSRHAIRDVLLNISWKE